jgi:anthranilate phosphoribosyltransferase
MPAAHAIKRLACRNTGEHFLSEPDAFEIFSAALDGGVGEFELGALLGVLATRPLGSPELAGFRHAAQARLNRFIPPPGPRPVAVPSYGSGRTQANLMPLIALALARFGVPVLVHGPLDGQGGVASASVLRELGVFPCATLQEAHDALESSHIAFVPTALLCPALGGLVALHARLGVPTCAGEVAPLIDPFGGAALKLVPAGSEDRRQALASVLAGLGEHALLFQGCQGEAFPDPLQRPAMTLFDAGEGVTLFDGQAAPALAATARAGTLPEQADAKSTAVWTEQVLAGKHPMPLPIANLLACCLFGAGYAEDFNQAKAIVALRGHTLSTA